MDFLRKNGWWIVAALFAAYKVLLMRSQPIYAVARAAHDDALFMNLAAHIARGEWLGPYNALTLAKGAAYPAFIASTFQLGLPLALIQQLLFVVACFVIASALKPWIKPGWLRGVVVVFLLFNPITYDGPDMSRILRQHLSVPMAMVALASMLALAARRQVSIKDKWGWALCAGLALGVFWNTREDGVWILPAVGMLGTVIWFDALRRQPGALLRAAAITVIGIAGFFLPTWKIAHLNQEHYGWFGTVELRADAFRDAYGALSRVDVGEPFAQVPISREAREATYAQSPAFAQLRPFLEEGIIMERWIDRSRFPAEAREFSAGWFMWAFRDAVHAAGHGESPQAFFDYCRQLAAEVNAACDEGRLASVDRRSGFLPRWHPSYEARFKNEALSYLNEAMLLSQFLVLVPYSEGTDDDIRMFVDLSYDNVSPSPQATYFHKPERAEHDKFKHMKIAAIGLMVRDRYRTAFWVAGALWLLRAVSLLGQRRDGWVWWAATATLLSALAAISLNFVVHVMAFDNLFPRTFASSYPFLQVFVALVATDVIRAWILPGVKIAKAKLLPRTVAPAPTEPAA